MKEWPVKLLNNFICECVPLMGNITLIYCLSLAVKPIFNERHCKLSTNTYMQPTNHPYSRL